MNKIAIYGAGGFGREVALLIDQINKVERTWDFIGFFDDGFEKGDKIDGFDILGRLQEANDWPDSLSLIVAIADPIIRKKLARCISNERLNFPILTHPTAILGSETNYIG